MDQTTIKEPKKIQKQIEALDKKLDAHISFIESVYNPLSKSIDRFKKIFKWTKLQNNKHWLTYSNMIQKTKDTNQKILNTSKKFYSKLERL